MHRFAAFGSPEYQSAWRQRSRNSLQLRKMARFPGNVTIYGTYTKVRCRPIFLPSGQQLRGTPLISQRSDDIDANASGRRVRVGGLSWSVGGKVSQLTKLARNEPQVRQCSKPWQKNPKLRVRCFFVYSERCLRERVPIRRRGDSFEGTASPPASQFADDQNAWRDRYRKWPKLQKMAQCPDTLVNHGKYPNITFTP